MPKRLRTLWKSLGRIDHAFFLSFLLYLGVRLIAPSSGLALALTIVFYALAGVEAVRLARLAIVRAIWRLRNRLIVAHAFIALVPVILIAILVIRGGHAVLGQVAAYLVTSELDRRTSEILGPAHMLAGLPRESRAGFLARLAPYFERRLPRVEVLVDEGGKLLRYPESSTLASPPSGWQAVHGVVEKAGRLYGWAHVAHGAVQVTFLAPLTRSFLADLIPGLGNVDTGSARLLLPDGTERRSNRLPPPANRFDTDFTWIAPLTIGLWDSPGKFDQGMLMIQSRTSAVLSTTFGRTAVYGQGWFLVFALVGLLFLLVELISLIIGVSLTRTITRAVHELYEGTQRIKEGDFSHRIAVRGKDQLAELAASFNRMTENLDRLIVVEKERERLQSELEIAREVQSQLFPRSAPALKTVEMAGLCHPARMVSGDYYDYLPLDETSVALAIGDVAGKGISAALLMAAIQSIMRTQLSAGISMAAAAGNGGAPRAFSSSHLVSVLNKQLYANTSPEKYATFYFGLYDESTGLLTYTNAGHLSPMLLRNSHLERLEPTGTVVGAFPFSRYGEKTVQLIGGDLLLAFTDGIVEPENEYGEMFGEERLAEMAIKLGRRSTEEIMAEIMEAVRRWTGSPELQDDMTLLLVRRK